MECQPLPVRSACGIGSFFESECFCGLRTVTVDGFGKVALSITDAANNFFFRGEGWAKSEGSFVANANASAGTGIALAEIYDSTPDAEFNSSTPRLTNISARTVVVVSLQPGGYTVQVSGVGNTSGVALVEIYELPE